MFSMVASLFLKVTLLLAAALLADALLRRRWVLATATLWNAVLLALLVLPLATMLAPQLTLPLLPVDSNRVVALSSTPVGDESPSRSIPTDLRARGLKLDSPELREPSVANWRPANDGMLLALLTGIYALGVVAFLARLIIGWQAAKALRDQSIPVTNTRWLDRLEFWMSGRSRRVTLLQSDLVDVPTALGVRKPAILIPSTLVQHATSRTVDSVLIHELAHVYRADCAWQLLDRVVHAALWPHPLMWIAQRRIAFIRERACDDFAVHRMGDFRAYGETLLDIAAGIRNRRATRLGLTIVRSSHLAQRLSAISQSAGSNRCVAAPSARWSLMAAILCGAIGLGSLAVNRAAAKDPPGSTTPPTNAFPANVSPELIAVTWQQVPESNNKRIEQPVWRPDGKRLTDAEANALLGRVKSFQTQWWNKEETLRPLVLVYRRPPGIHTGLMTSIVMPDGRRKGPGTWMYSLANGLANSSSSPRRADLKSWPATVDLDVKVPLEDPQVFKTIKTITKEPVQVAEGVRWYLDYERGIDGSNQSGFTGGALELRGEELQAPIIYRANIFLRGHKDPVPEGIATCLEPKPGDFWTLRVSRAIKDVDSIERVEFTRQRFLFERIKGVETHLDLLPPDP